MGPGASDGQSPDVKAQTGRVMQTQMRAMTCHTCSQTIRLICEQIRTSCMQHGCMCLLCCVFTVQGYGRVQGCEPHSGTLGYADRYIQVRQSQPHIRRFPLLATLRWCEHVCVCVCAHVEQAAVTHPLATQLTGHCVAKGSRRVQGRRVRSRALAWPCKLLATQ